MVAKFVDNIWDELKMYMITDNFIFITDKNIYNLYRKQIDKLMNRRDNLYLINPGEKNKGLEELTNIYEILIQKGIDREGIILSLGGGIVGDLAGFAASTYKRGIKYIQSPTTLLAQVDSSLGGKTGIDFLGHKNIIGSFHFPLFTIVDHSFIDTLPEKEITCGLGEIIKYGLIEDYDFLKYIENNIQNIYKRNKKTLKYITRKSIEIKLSIVKEDKLDLGIRQKLNFGHTIGHSIESFFHYERYNHGEAIIIGMIFESNIAYYKKLINKEYYDEIIKILNPLVSLPIFNEEEAEKLIGYMENDKKNKSGKIGFILPIGKGEVDIFYDIDIELVKNTILYFKL